MRAAHSIKWIAVASLMLPPSTMKLLAIDFTASGSTPHTQLWVAAWEALLGLLVCLPATRFLAMGGVLTTSAVFVVHAAVIRSDTCGCFGPHLNLGWRSQVAVAGVLLAVSCGWLLTSRPVVTLDLTKRLFAKRVRP